MDIIVTECSNYLRLSFFIKLGNFRIYLFYLSKHVMLNIPSDLLFGTGFWFGLE